MVSGFQPYVQLNTHLYCCILGMFDSSASNTIKLRVKNTFDKDVQLMASDKQPGQGIQVRQHQIIPRISVVYKLKRNAGVVQPATFQICFQERLSIQNSNTKSLSGFWPDIPHLSGILHIGCKYELYFFLCSEFLVFCFFLWFVLFFVIYIQVSKGFFSNN